MRSISHFDIVELKSEVKSHEEKYKGLIDIPTIT